MPKKKKEKKRKQKKQGDESELERFLVRGVKKKKEKRLTIVIALGRAKQTIEVMMNGKKKKKVQSTMMMAVGYYQDVHSPVDDVTDFSNVPHNLITSRLDLEYKAFVFFCQFNKIVTNKKILSPCLDNLDI